MLSARTKDADMNSQPSLLERVFLRAQHFEIRQPYMTLDECAERINALDRPKDTFFTRSTLVASATRSIDDDNRYFFSMVTQHQGRYQWYSGAEIAGDMILDPQTGDTIVSGIVKMSQGVAWRIYLYGALAVVIALLSSFHSGAWFPVTICAIIALRYIYQGISDRQQLRDTLTRILTAPSYMKEKRSDTQSAGDVIIEIPSRAVADALYQEDETQLRRAGRE
jgi:hypothetical protein